MLDSRKVSDSLREERSESLVCMLAVTPRVNSRNYAENLILKYGSGLLYTFECSAARSEFSGV